MHTGKTLFLLYLLKCITANTTTENRVQQEAVAACQNLTSSTSNDGTTITTSQFPDPSCWDTLSMTDWMTYWNSSTTVCTTTQKANMPCQCLVDEPWATCFMRLTYARNKTASYLCTDLTKPGNCTLPIPSIVVPGPAEIFYGAYSIWTLFRYLTIWHDVLTSTQSLPAITAELSDSKSGAQSASHLLVSLVQSYAVDPAYAQHFVDILTTSPLVGDGSSPVRPTLSNAQQLLGQLLQQVLAVVMTDFACGDFQAMAGGGMLLNGTTETKKLLLARLGQQEKMR